MSGARVVGLQRTPSRRAQPERVDEALVKEDWGIEGDHHARAGRSRQVVIVQAEVLDELRLAPGATREQLTIRGAGEIGAGTILTIGDVHLEVVLPRVPCRVMDGIRPGLKDEMLGRGGWCARVTAGGTIKVGDSVEVGHRDDPAFIKDYRAAMAEWEAAPNPEATLPVLIAWDQRAADRIEQLGSNDAPPTWIAEDIDAFNAAAVERFKGQDLWGLHDKWATAVTDLARRHPDRAEPWVKMLAANYREHM